MNFNNFWRHWQTTSAAIVVLLVWLIPLWVPTLKITPQVQTALTAVIGSIGLLFAKDPGGK